MDDAGKFRRNMVLIALGHVLVIGGIVAWSLRAEHPASEQVNWLDLAAGAAGGAGKAGGNPPPPDSDEETGASPTPSVDPETDARPSPTPRSTEALTDTDREFATHRAIPTPTPPPTPRPTPTPTPTPKPTSTPTPKPTPTPTPKPTPKPTPTPTPKPTATPKPKPTPTPKPKPTPTPKPKPKEDADDSEKPKPTAKPKSDEQAKANKPKEEKGKTADKPKKPGDSTAKSDSPETAAKKAEALAALHSNGDGDGPGDGGRGTGKGAGRGTGTSGEGSGNSAEIVAAYNEMIKDRFYSQWDQPTVAGGAAASNDVAFLTIRVEKDGRISDAHVSRPSGSEQMDASVRAAAEHVKKIEPLPAALAKKDSYVVTIKFNRTD